MSESYSKFKFFATVAMAGFGISAGWIGTVATGKLALGIPGFAVAAAGTVWQWVIGEPGTATGEPYDG